MAPTKGRPANRTAVVETAIPTARGLTIGYAPAADGAPDPGEIVWAWVPFAEDPARGKDRPLLVLGRRDEERYWAMKLTSRPHDRDREHLALGSGDWDRSGRESWLDLDQIYLVHRDGIRREAGHLDRRRFAGVAAELTRRYGWPSAR